MDKISVIIPTYNRFKYVLNTIKSIQNQTYDNIEIIVVNDNSTEEEYYTHKWQNIIIHLTENSKNKFGYPCAGYVRNKGIEIATGTYIAFCDDDDIWFPNKLELQINAMQQSNCKISCTDGIIGKGEYISNNTYPKYNEEFYYKDLQNIYKNKKSSMLDNGLPNIWTKEFLQIHNCVICSSVVVEKELLSKINMFNCYRNGQEDYDCWLRVLDHTTCIYIKEPCIYYDMNHGYGQNY